MLIYFILYIFLFFMAFICFQTDFFGKENKAQKAFCIAGCIALVLIMSLRDQSTGIDIVTRNPKIGYYDMFTYISKLSLSESFTVSVGHYERGYIVFCKLLSYISKDPQILLAACAIIQSVCLFVLIYKTSKKPLLSTIIYFALPCYYIFYSGLRQGIAISITIIAFFMIKEKKPIKFVLLVILAWLFHSSAIVFLIAYPIYYFKQSSTWKLISVAIIPIVYIFRDPLFSVLSRIFKDEAEAVDTGAFTLFLVFILMYLFLMVFVNKNNELSNGCTNLFWIACLIQAFSGISNLAMRVGYYFMIYSIVAIPEVLANEDGGGFTLNYKNKNVINVLLFVIFAAYGLYTMAYKNILYRPYSFFWEHI